VVSQGDIVAESLRDYLLRHPEMDAKCSKKGSVRFYTTESVTKFEQTAGLFLNRKVEVEHLVL
jgi:glutamate racemase